MSPPLTPDDLQALRASLQSRRAELERQRDQHLGGQSRAEHARDLLQQDGDDDTQRDADREVDHARSDRDAVMLAEIEQALQRLALGSYGLCTDCGAEIPPARLALAPQARRCVACESKLERNQPRPATM